MVWCIEITGCCVIGKGGAWFKSIWEECNNSDQAESDIGSKIAWDCSHCRDFWCYKSYLIFLDSLFA